MHVYQVGKDGSVSRFFNKAVPGMLDYFLKRIEDSFA